MAMPDSLKSYMDEKGSKELATNADHRSPGVQLLTQEVTRELLPHENIAGALEETGYLSTQDTMDIKEAKFYRLASETAGSEKFLQALSDKVGAPREHESKEAFVERMVDEARRMLYRKLNIKDK